MTSSSAAPIRAPTTMPMASDSQNGAFQSITSRYRSAAANPPISPTAKLITLVDRKTSTTPTAITP